MKTLEEIKKYQAFDHNDIYNIYLQGFEDGKNYISKLKEELFDEGWEEDDEGCLIMDNEYEIIYISFYDDFIEVIFEECKKGSTETIWKGNHLTVEICRELINKYLSK